MNVRLACSPDADDLFMMRALMEDKIDTEGLSFDIVTQPTDALNRTSESEDAPHVAAISFAQYPAVADKWRLLAHGGSMGEGYGPVIISKTPMSVADLAGLRMAIPGASTTAWLITRMILGQNVSVDPVVTPISPYTLIFDELRAGNVDVGLVIHEGRLTYEREGFHKVVDIGVWWEEQTGGLPLPLGANAIRRDLAPELQERISRVVRNSVVWALENREDSMQWILQRSEALTTRAQVDEYLNMYANGRTLGYGPAGEAGIEALFARSVAEGMLSKMPSLDLCP